jgi:hypothetical protein
MRRHTLRRSSLGRCTGAIGTRRQLRTGKPGRISTKLRSSSRPLARASPGNGARARQAAADGKCGVAHRPATCAELRDRARSGIPGLGDIQSRRQVALRLQRITEQLCAQRLALQRLEVRAMSAQRLPVLMPRPVLIGPVLAAPLYLIARAPTPCEVVTGKISFQSVFMSTTVQPFTAAASSATSSRPKCVLRS